MFSAYSCEKEVKMYGLFVEKARYKISVPARLQIKELLVSKLRTDSAIQTLEVLQLLT
jgi:hypothetical protein